MTLHAWFLACALCFVCTTARAELAWVRVEGAESCVGDERLRALLVAHGVATGTLDAQRSEGAIEPFEGGFRARIRVQGADGALGPTRAVETRSADCEQLTPSIVLVIAMLLEGERAHTPSPIRAPRGDRAHHDTFEAAWQLGYTWGLLRSPAYGPTTTFRFTTPTRVGALLGFGASLPIDGEFNYDDDNYGLILRAFHAPAALCVDALRSEVFQVVPCAGVLVGGMRAINHQEKTHISTDFFALATLGARLVWNAKPGFRVLVDVNLGGLLRGPVYRYGYPDMGVRYTDVFRPERIQVQAAFGVANTF